MAARSTEDDEWEKAQVEMTKKLSQLSVRVPLGSVDATWANQDATGMYGFYSNTAALSPLSRATTSAVSSSAPLDPVLTAALENPRERLTLLQFEDQIVQFLKAPRENELTFPPLSSYHRLIVHRLAERCALEHQTPDYHPQNAMVYDNNAPRVVTLYKTPRCFIPSVLLINLSSELNPPATPTPHIAPPKIMTRKPTKGTTSKHPRAASADTPNRSIQDREKAYAEARARIFGDADDSNSSPSTSSTTSDPPAAAVTPTIEPNGRRKPQAKPNEVKQHKHDWKETKAQYRDRAKEMNDPDFARHTSYAPTYGRGAAYDNYRGYGMEGRMEYRQTNSGEYYRQPMARRFQPPPSTPQVPMYTDKDFPPLGQ